MPKLATNVIVGKLLLVCAVLALLLSCGDNVHVVPMVRIPPGMRGLSIPINEGISVVPGDHVDVLVVGKGQETKTVLENVEVAAAEKESGVVVFLVSPDDAQRVTDAGEQGKFRLRLWKSN
jgi:Flp pilus assembly protein CpaB